MNQEAIDGETTRSDVYLEKCTCTLFATRGLSEDQKQNVAMRPQKAIRKSSHLSARLAACCKTTQVDDALQRMCSSCALHNSCRGFPFDFKESLLRPFAQTTHVESSGHCLILNTRDAAHRRTVRGKPSCLLGARRLRTLGRR